MDGEYHGDKYSNSIKLWAKIKANNRLIYARDATKKDGPFYCTETFEDLIVRKCIV